jgi:hypothetical protein
LFVCGQNAFNPVALLFTKLAASRVGVTLTYSLTIIELTGVFIAQYYINKTRVKGKEEAK